jgi:hypothetical protein
MAGIGMDLMLKINSLQLISKSDSLIFKKTITKIKLC